MTSSNLLDTIHRFFHLLGEHMDVRFPREILVNLTYDGWPYNEPFESDEFRHYLDLIGLRDRIGSLSVSELGQAHIKNFGGVSPWFSMYKIHEMGYAFHIYSPSSLVLVTRRVDVKF